MSNGHTGSVIQAVLVLVAVPYVLASGRSDVVSRGQAQPVRGVVLDASTDRPVSDARVTIVPNSLDLGGQRSGALIALTDANGVFSVQLSASQSYHIRASKAGFLDGAYGQYSAGDVPRDFVGLATPTETITIRLWPPGAIAGRVYDEFDDPVIGAPVTLLEASYVAGRRIAKIIAQEKTDDRGAFRFGSLLHGEYSVAVLSTVYAVPESTMAMIEDLFSLGGAAAARQIARRYEQTGVKRPTSAGTKVGGFYLQGLWAGGLVEAASSAAQPYRYDTAYFGGGRVWSTASVVRLESGETRVGTDIVLRPVATRQVSGIVEGMTGPISHVGVTLHGGQESIPSEEPPFASTVTDAHGKFTIFGVPVGRYIARAVNVPGEPLPTGASTTLAPLDQAFMAEAVVDVGEQPTPTVTLVALPSPAIRGRVELRQVPSAADILPQIRVAIASLSASRSTIASLEVDGAGRFESSGLAPGRYRIDLSVPPGTSAEALLVRGRDALGKSFDVAPGDPPVEVDITIGRTPERDLFCSLPGDSTARAYVFVVPQDYSRWLLDGASPHWLRFGFAVGGTFVARNLPEGEYLVIAGVGNVPAVENPAEMTSLVNGGTVARVRGRGPHRVTIARLADTRVR